ncbi:unnamed protein product, partial [marine sediment metagenome]
FGTEEQQKRMLEAVDRRNESLDTFGKSLGEFGRAFNKGMDKLDKHADDLLKLITMLEFLKQIFDEKLRKKMLMKEIQQKIIPICPIHKTPMKFSEETGWGCKKCSPCPAVSDQVDE